MESFKFKEYRGMDLIGNKKEWIAELEIHEAILEEKKQQTDYKIQYVSSYVDKWIKVQVNRPNICNINFIDCMCNAGIYKDGDLATSMLVLQVFIREAKVYPQKQFHLFLNDIDENKVKSIRMIGHKICDDAKIKNVHVQLSKSDVNSYLDDTTFGGCLGGNSATILFVDPYDFGTVKINSLSTFIQRHYCEVVFNFFTSDYVRNKIDARIKECIGRAVINDKEELVAFIRDQIKVGKIRFVFSYSFKTQTNTELYQILYATPHAKGLKLLKNALWDTFKGREFHRNVAVIPEQISLFSAKTEREMAVEHYSIEAQELLMERFAGQALTYTEMEIYIIENTMLEDSKIIKHVIRPLIEKSKIIKSGIPKIKNNYKDDTYIIGGK
jgi:three-Cys-motif partner protein